MFAIEEYTGDHLQPVKNPGYHTTGDTLDKLNLVFHAEVTRGLVAALASFANP